MEVFRHYRTYHPRSYPNPQPDSKEWKAIRSRLKEGYDVATLKAAIDGCHRTPHNMGQNERGQKYLGLELIMRNGGQVARFSETAKDAPYTEQLFGNETPPLGYELASHPETGEYYFKKIGELI
jgi:hypothetical protein